MAQVFAGNGYRFSFLNQSPIVSALLGAVVASLPHISGPERWKLVKALTEFERFSAPMACGSDDADRKDAVPASAPAHVVAVPRQILSGLVKMAESHVGDIVSGIEEGFYQASDNPGIDGKQCTVRHAALLLEGKQSNGSCDHGG